MIGAREGRTESESMVDNEMSSQYIMTVPSAPGCPESVDNGTLQQK